MRKAFVRACCQLDMTGIRPYDLRHSYATAILMATKDLRATQLSLRHRHQRTTNRYGTRALNPIVTAAQQQAQAAGVFGKLPEVTKSRENATNPNKSKQGGGAKTRRHWRGKR
jgi:hypothetical protein